MKRLPSIQTLQAFESAVRHGSFSRAAEELHLTHGAISRHIHKLEDWYGRPLFDRNGPRVAPTAAADHLRQRLTDPLQGLHDALDLPWRPHPRQSLYVSTLVSIAETWLLPNLNDFKTQCPDIDLSIATDYQLVSIPPASKVIALRVGNFDHRGLATEKLYDETMLAVATPEWIEHYGEHPGDWPPSEMLVHTSSPWPTTLKPNGARSLLKLPAAAGPRFNDAWLCLRAAARGAGVAWTRSHLARRLLDSGDLQAIDGVRQKSDRSYWFVCREEWVQDPTIERFRAWLTGVIAR